MLPLYPIPVRDKNHVHTGGGRNYSRKVCALATQNAFMSKRTADGSVRVQPQQRYLCKKRNFAQGTADQRSVWTQ